MTKQFNIKTRKRMAQLPDYDEPTWDTIYFLRQEREPLICETFGDFIPLKVVYEIIKIEGLRALNNERIYYNFAMEDYCYIEIPVRRLEKFRRTEISAKLALPEVYRHAVDINPTEFDEYFQFEVYCFDKEHEQRYSDDMHIIIQVLSNEKVCDSDFKTGSIEDAYESLKEIGLVDHIETVEGISMSLEKCKLEI